MFKTYLKAIFLSIFCALNASAAHSVSLLRDPDIEYGLQQLAEPILRAANLNSDDVKVWIVNDMGLNAFIIDNKHIFVHAGLVLQLKTAAQLQSVIAHEAAHITMDIFRDVSPMFSGPIGPFPLAYWLPPPQF